MLTAGSAMSCTSRSPNGNRTVHVAATPFLCRRTETRTKLDMTPIGQPHERVPRISSSRRSALSPRALSGASEHDNYARQRGPLPHGPRAQLRHDLPPVGIERLVHRVVHEVDVELVDAEVP